MGKKRGPGCRRRGHEAPTGGCAVRRRGDAGETRRGLAKPPDAVFYGFRKRGTGRDARMDRDGAMPGTVGIDRPRRRSGHAPAAPEISATIWRSAEPSAAAETARMGATATRPRARETASGARSAAAGALMEASAEDVIGVDGAETCRHGKGGATPFRRLPDERSRPRPSPRFLN